MDIKKRFQFVDIAKGISILMVVTQHVLGNYASREILFLLYPSIYVFFFLSGYCSYRDFRTQPISLRDYILKCTRLLIPFCVFSLIVLFRSDLTVAQYFTNSYKYGYWFVYVLFLIFIWFYSVFQIHKKILKMPFRILLTVLTILVVFIIKLELEVMYRILSLDLFVITLPIFLMGFYSRKYNDLFIKCISNKWLFLIYSLLVFLLFDYYPSNKLLSYCIRIFISLVSVFCVLFVSRNSKYMNLFRIIAPYTLGIYLLHFFLVKYAQEILSYATSRFVAIPLGIFCSFLIIVVVGLLVNILNNNRLFSICLGMNRRFKYQ